jgi:hypothetical protein
MLYDLAVCIPARSEEFVNITVDGILKAKRGKTEIIVGLDENWATPGIVDHPDVTIIHYSQSIGQRAITNRCVDITKAKLIMKLDGHAIVSDGFDLALLEAFEKLGPDIVQIPILYNLHAFDRVCPKCEHRIYQGPEPINCEKCGTQMVREMIWKPRFNRKSEFYRFDKTLHFQYWNSHKNSVPSDEPYPETMSAQGSCFVVSRKKYIELNLGDENFGSWGNQGTQVACSTWLSGGRLITNRKCWYSHLFRTQGQSFGFPYPLSGKQVDFARKYSQDLFLNNKYKQAIHPFEWLIEKFRPIPDWHPEPLKIEPRTKKGIIFYTDNQLNLKIAHAVQDSLRRVNLPIVSASLKPMPHFGTNVVIHEKRGYLTLFKQILAALELSRAEYVFFTEHDNIVHPSRFDFTPPKKDVWYYNLNWWKCDLDGRCAQWSAEQVSGICVYRLLAIDYYKKRIEQFNAGKFDRKFEPMSGMGSVDYFAKYPDLDIRHAGTLTKSKWSLDDFRDKSTAKGFKLGTFKDIPGWDFSKGLLKAIALR